MAKRRKSTFERLQNGELNRQQRRELGRRLNSSDPELMIVHPDAAGIDVGNASHFAAVPAGRDERPVREFGSWTAALREMAAWLKSCGVRTVAMQSTGVYWIALLEELEAAGLEVYLVNARGTKNLPGRKSDVQECQWLLKLHTYGLLRNSFRPPEQVRAIRTIWRQRDRLVQDAGRAVQQMQKALTTMNVQLANRITDISGVTGMAIIRAILAGTRDPWTLAEFRDRRCAASIEEIAHSLEGNWREDVLFELGQVVEAYDFYQKQMAACDEQLQRYLRRLPERRSDVDPTTKSKTPRKNQPHFDLRGQLHLRMGVDLTRIDGIDVMTAQVILAELGTDLSAFPDEDQFSMWLQLAPRQNVTGGKVIKHLKAENRNRVAAALRMAAQALSHSDSYLGARYRRLRSHMEGPKAIKAMAHYLARLVYRLLTKGQDYVDRGAVYFETKRRERETAALQRKAAELGLQLVPLG